MPQACLKRRLRKKENEIERKRGRDKWGNQREYELTSELHGHGSLRSLVSLIEDWNKKKFQTEKTPTILIKLLYGIYLIKSKRFRTLFHAISFH